LNLFLGVIHDYFPFSLGCGTGAGGAAGLRGLRLRFGAGRGGWCDFCSRNFIVCLSAAATGARFHHASVSSVRTAVDQQELAGSSPALHWRLEKYRTNPAERRDSSCRLMVVTNPRV
jgi:hypothetical protein